MAFNSLVVAREEVRGFEKADQLRLYINRKGNNATSRFQILRRHDCPSCQPVQTDVGYRTKHPLGRASFIRFFGVSRRKIRLSYARRTNAAKTFIVMFACARVYQPRTQKTNVYVHFIKYVTARIFTGLSLPPHVSRCPLRVRVSVCTPTLDLRVRVRNIQRYIGCLLNGALLIYRGSCELVDRFSSFFETSSSIFDWNGDETKETWRSRRQTVTKCRERYLSAIATNDHTLSGKRVRNDSAQPRGC